MTIKIQQTSGSVQITAKGSEWKETVTVAWNQVIDKPSVFPPSAHTHATGDITGLDSILAPLQAQVDEILRRAFFYGVR